MKRIILAIIVAIMAFLPVYWTLQAAQDPVENALQNKENTAQEPVLPTMPGVPQMHAPVDPVETSDENAVDPNSAEKPLMDPSMPADPLPQAGPLELPVETPAPIPVVGDTTQCVVDADCVLVQSGCCGCNAGGERTAINTRSLESTMESISKNCGDTMCAMMMSNHASCSDTAKAACQGGHCAVAVPAQ